MKSQRAAEACPAIVQNAKARLTSSSFVETAGAKSRRLPLLKFGKRMDGPRGRRWLKRRPVGILGSALFIGGSSSVLIQDLSISGARLLGRELPSAGTDVLLKVGERSLLGQIAWRAGDHGGLSFDFGRP